MKNNQRGSTILVVVIAATVTLFTAASVLSLITTQRNLALRKELEMQAINTAEAALDYAYSSLTNQIGTAGDFSISAIPTSGNTALALPSGASNFVNGTVSVPSGSYSGTTGTVTFSDVQVRIQSVAASSTRRWIDPADPANSDDPNRGQWVWENTVPLVARVKAAQGSDSYTAYVQKNMVSRQVPMFQHAIFFQGQLQLHRSYRIVGPVHTNGTMLLNAQNGDTSVYSGSLTSSGKFYRGASCDAGGTGVDPYGYTPVNLSGDLDFSTGVSPLVNLVATGTNRISLYVESQTSGSTTTHVTGYLNGGTDSRSTSWRSDALRTYKGQLQDKSHQVPTFTPQGSEGYRQDVSTTAAINEFSNGTYSLIEPLLPLGHASRKSDTSRSNKIAARAGLILRIERNNAFAPAGAVPSGGWNAANEWQATNRNQRFVVKAYKYATRPAAGVEPVLSPVRLPDQMIGEANATITAVIAGRPYAEKYVTNGATSTSSVTVSGGLHDPRLGRPVEPFTLNMARFKAVLEGTATDATAVAFRSDFSPTDDWNGVVYVEMPTSLTPNTAVAANTTQTAGLAISTQPYNYGAAELRHPDRAAETDNHGRMNRTDRIVPIAPELRKYPTSNTAANMQSAQWAIPALQIINATQLPNPTDSPGMTLGTNLPIYIVGSYNCDGNTSTGTNLSSMAPDAYATNDAGEVPAAIFCDTLTVLSSAWPTNRAQSFKGAAGNSSLRVATSRIEIAACIATGEYPVFEFFTHAAENFQTLYNSGPPIVFKGSVIGMFKSEIQHYKTAYGRSASNQIEDYWNDHGAFAIPSVRFHQSLVDGTFPPGIPMAIIFRPKDHRFLRPGNVTDQATIAAAGF